MMSLFTPEAIDMNDLPVEILCNIFHNIDYLEKQRLREVCSLWKDCVDEMMERSSSKDIQDTLDLVYHKDEYNLSDYGWYICPRQNPENMCVAAGWKIVEYAILAEDMPEEYPNNPLARSLYALTTVTTTSVQRKLLTKLREQFVNSRITLFNELFATNLTVTDIGATQEDIPLLLVIERDNGELFIEFTLNEPDTYHPADYKICVTKTENGENAENANTFEWLGQGDDWLDIDDPKEILQRFWKEDEQRYTPFHNNDGSRTISHLLELVVFATQQHILKNKK